MRIEMQKWQDNDNNISGCRQCVVEASGKTLLWIHK